LIIATDTGVGTWQIGDSATVLQWSDETLELATVPMKGEYANETRMLTSGRRHGEGKTWKKLCSGIVAFTDGLDLLALEQSSRPFGPFISPLVKFAASDGSCDADLEELLESPTVRSRTGD